jgi:hypothetical protein
MKIRKFSDSVCDVIRPLARIAMVALAPAVGANTLNAQPISVPNYSFESPSGVGQPFGVNVLVDSWQKPTKPDYFNSIEQNYGIYWIQTAGVFVDTNPYGNAQGTQAGYILSFPQVALFQDYGTMDWNDPAPTHDFDATFEIGKSYQLTVGLFAKVLSAGGLTDGSMLQISLYYRDALENMVPVGAKTVTYASADFPLSANLKLMEEQVNVPTVQSGDAWAGQHIGIKLESLYGDGSVNWDFDNVRLTAVPEPSVLSLAGMAFAGWFIRCARSRRE